jgi:integrase
MSTDLQTVTLDGAALAPYEAPPLDRNPAAVYLAGLGSEASRRTMAGALYDVVCIMTRPAPGTLMAALDNAPRPSTAAERLADVLAFPWAALRFQHTAAIRAELAQRHAPATANKALSALRGVLRAAWQLGQMTAEEYHTAAAVKAVKGGPTDPAGRALTPGEIAALLRACAEDPTPAGIRDGAMIALLYAAGPRRAEVVALDLADLDPGDEGAGWLTIRHGKGNKARRVPVNNGALEALLDWLSVRGGDPGPLFVAINRGGRLALGDRLTSQAIYNMLRKRGAEAGLKDFSPHDFRRTFVGDLLDAGADVVTAQHLAGHANVTTTARYDRRGDRAKVKAVGLLHVPYQRRRLA